MQLTMISQAVCLDSDKDQIGEIYPIRNDHNKNTNQLDSYTGSDATCIIGDVIV